MRILCFPVIRELEDEDELIPSDDRELLLDDPLSVWVEKELDSEGELDDELELLTLDGEDEDEFKLDDELDPDVQVSQELCEVELDPGSGSTM